MKNKILIGVFALATIAAGYYIYTRIRDRNKTIIPVVGGVIVLDDDYPSTPSSNQLVDDLQDLPDDLIQEPLIEEGEEPEEEPIWSSEDIPNYGADDTIL